MKKKVIEKEKGFFQKIIENVAENVKEGASFVGEKVVETSAKAIAAGSELVAETTEKINDFNEKQALQKEEKIIFSRQEELKLSFGEMTLTNFLKNNSINKSFLTTKKIENVVNEYLENEKRIKEIALGLEKFNTD